MSRGREEGQTPGSQLRHQLGDPYVPVLRTSVLVLMPAVDDEVSEFHLKTPGQEIGEEMTTFLFIAAWKDVLRWDLIKATICSVAPFPHLLHCVQDQPHGGALGLRKGEENYQVSTLPQVQTVAQSLQCS